MAAHPARLSTSATSLWRTVRGPEAGVPTPSLACHTVPPVFTTRHHAQ